MGGNKKKNQVANGVGFITKDTATRMAKKFDAEISVDKCVDHILLTAYKTIFKKLMNSFAADSISELYDELVYDLDKKKDKKKIREILDDKRAALYRLFRYEDDKALACFSKFQKDIRTEIEKNRKTSLC